MPLSVFDLFTVSVGPSSSHCAGATKAAAAFAEHLGSLDKDSTNLPEEAIYGRRIPFPFTSGQELLSLCERYNVSISELVMANESANRSPCEIREGVLEIHKVMQDCITRGIQEDGPLSATHNARRKAKTCFEKLSAEDPDYDPFFAPEWVSLVALAVTEEHAAGGRVVTAPTNGAAGIIPAVLYYATAYVPRLAKASLDDRSDAIVRFFLTAAAVGSLLHMARTAIAEVEVGCLGEVRSATAMAAAGLAELLGGTPAQIETAAVFGMEHTPGLICDSFQAPCVNHSAMASNTAIAVARMAVRGDGAYRLSFDEILRTISGMEVSKGYTEAATDDLAATLLTADAYPQSATRGM